MKENKCPSYNKNTEIQKTEVGSAYGKPLYVEKEIILSESCSILNKVDDFDCSQCPLREGLLKDEK
jgi:hypothetical protein